MRAPSLVLASLLLIACGSDPVSTPPDSTGTQQLTLRVNSGNGQIALQYADFPEPVVVQAVDQHGTPIAGIEISAGVIEGRGALDADRRTTNAGGLATFTWSAGADYDQSVRFTAEGQTAEASGVALYRHAPPPDIGDGWPTRALSQGELQPALDIIDGVRSGRWQNIHSLLIAKSGEFVLETYFPGSTSNGQFVNWNRATPHEVQSASKSYRSALIGMAIDRGLISSVDAPLTAFFPDFAGELTGTKATVTLEHVLTMSTGLEWNESGAASGNTDNNLSRMYATPSWNWTTYVLTRPIQYTPGSTFVYNTGASIMLNDILARGTGMTVSQFVRDYMADPMESDLLPGVGNPLGAATLPRDMLKLGQVFLTRGMWKDTRVLSEWWVDESLVERFQFSSGVSYGYQWWMRTVSTDARTYRIQYAAGNGGQYIILVRDLDLVVVSTGGNFGSSLSSQIWTMLEDGILPAFE